MTLMRFPELEKVLTQYYPLLNCDGWVRNDFAETGDTTYETECDNFPVPLDDLTLYLEAVFWVVPDKKVFLIEAYTALFEAFPQPAAFLNEGEFLGQLPNKQFLTNMISRLTENHPLTPQTPTEIERLYFFWKATQEVHDGGGRILFPEEIRRKITTTVQEQLKGTDWKAMMCEEYLDYI